MYHSSLLKGAPQKPKQGNAVCLRLRIRSVGPTTANLRKHNRVPAPRGLRRLQHDGLLLWRHWIREDLHVLVALYPTLA